MSELPAAPKLHIWQVELAPVKSSVALETSLPLSLLRRSTIIGIYPTPEPHAIMRIATISLGLLALLTPLTAAWSKEGESTPWCSPRPPIPALD